MRRPAFPRRRTGVLASAVLAASLAGALSTPGSAGASPTRTPDTTFTGQRVTVTGTVHPLTRAGATDTFVVTLTNHSKKPVAWQGDVNVFPGDFSLSPIWWQQVAVTISPLHAPPTTTMRRLNGPGFVVGFYPAGRPSDATFAIGAGKSLSWTVHIGLNRSFPANDDGLEVAFEAAPPNGPGGIGPDPGVALHIPASPHIRPGHMDERLTPDGAHLSPGRPLGMSLLVHNTGSAQFSAGLATRIKAFEFGTGRPLRVPLALDVWENGRWVPLPYRSGSWILPDIPPGLGGGAAHTYWLRARTQATARDVSQNILLDARTELATGYSYPIDEVEALVHVAS